MLPRKVMYAKCVFLCVFLCRYLGLGTSDDGQKCWRAGLCMPGVCLCVFLYRYLWLGTSNDGQKCWRAGLCMPGVCFCMCFFCVGTWGVLTCGGECVLQVSKQYLKSLIKRGKTLADFFKALLKSSSNHPNQMKKTH